MGFRFTWNLDHFGVFVLLFDLISDKRIAQTNLTCEKSLEGAVKVGRSVEG